MPKCAACGKEFAGEHALKIHTGRMHGAGKPAKAAKGKKARKAAGRSAAEAFKCPDCGRTFRLSMHLARHRAASHGLASRKARPAGRPAAPSRGANISVELGDLTIDQLLSLRDAVSQRLEDVVRKIRGASAR